MLTRTHRLARLRRLVLALALAGLSQAPAGAGAAAEPLRVAVFDFELIDTSLEGEVNGPQQEQTDRLEMLTRRLRAIFGEREGFEVVDIAPVRATAKRRHLTNCGACDGKMARELGADWAVVGTVQKVSNLILNVNLYVRDVASGDLVQRMSADIRGNTDKSWTRGLDYLVRNRLDLTP